MDFVVKTDVGQKRQNNEDAFYVKIYDENLSIFIVADGLGGYESGEVASKLLTDSFSKSIEENKVFINNLNEKGIENFLKESLEKANSLIYDLEKTDEKYKSMGTTIVLVLKSNDKIYYFSVGDSRIYYIDDQMSKIDQITEDDTYVNELVRTNIIDISEADNHPKKHILTKAIGIFKEIEINVKSLDKKDGYLLLCSDGMTNMLKEKEVLETFKKNKFQNIAEKLVSKSNDNGGNDNITVIVIKL